MDVDLELGMDIVFEETSRASHIWVYKFLSLQGFEIM